LNLEADDRVAGFQEKPQGDGGWINGGFFVLEPAVFDCIASDATVWEAEPLQGRVPLRGVKPEARMP